MIKVCKLRTLFKFDFDENSDFCDVEVDSWFSDDRLLESVSAEIRSCWRSFVCKKGYFIRDIADKRGDLA